ncbi:hypothetical protein NPIL_32431 [Nephila pilipes]|uniref:Uncharacterized protein n=1 Tax=Nephila pilipes TaxID=299642 RepID=A0A8X6PXE4_NEPPI|nr:hypothetical protein NPIL_32431 [Nephila pilipes]
MGRTAVVLQMYPKRFLKNTGFQPTLERNVLKKDDLKAKGSVQPALLNGGRIDWTRILLLLLRTRGCPKPRGGNVGRRRSWNFSEPLDRVHEALTCIEAARAWHRCDRRRSQWVYVGMNGDGLFVQHSLASVFGEPEMCPICLLVCTGL